MKTCARYLVVALLLLALCVPAAAQEPPVAPDEDAPTLVEPEPEPEPEVDEHALADAEIARRLRAIFAAVPEFAEVEVEVEAGVVRLRGEAPNHEAQATVASIAKSTPGVVYVDDRVTGTTTVSKRISPAYQAFRERGRALLLRLPLIVLAALVLLVFWFLSRQVARIRLLERRLDEQPLLHGLVSQSVRAGVFLCGVLLALEILDITALVGAVLGAVGVLGVALGFAFRDIAENYLASLFLSLRQPFRKNDLIEIGSLRGRVVRLDFRETVLMTTDGNHLRIPNSVVFKSNILNYTLNPLRRLTIKLDVGVNEDLAQVFALCRQALLDTPGVVADPAPQVLADELADHSVKLVVGAWMDQRRHGFSTVRSEAIRRVKGALDVAGVDMPEPILRVFTGALVDGLPPAPARPLPIAADAAPLETAEPEDQIEAQVAAEGNGDDLLTP